VLVYEVQSAAASFSASVGVWRFRTGRCWDRDGDRIAEIDDEEDLERYYRDPHLTFVAQRFELLEVSLTAVPVDPAAMIVRSLGDEVWQVRRRMMERQNRVLWSPNTATRDQPAFQSNGLVGKDGMGLNVAPARLCRPARARA
jgi:hypothetical protein